MPVYERQCEDCGEVNDFVESIQFAGIKRMETRCPSCGKVTWHKKLLSTFRFKFNQGGGVDKRMR